MPDSSQEQPVPNSRHIASAVGTDALGDSDNRCTREDVRKRRESHDELNDRQARRRDETRKNGAFQATKN